MREFKTGLPELPDLDEYKSYLDKIWESSHITNFGVFEREFEKSLSEYFGGRYVALFANGTNALEALVAVLDVRGNVLTSPFSFVATLNAITRNKLKAAYVDVENSDGTLDGEQLRQEINNETGLVLAVHPYSYACDIDSLEGETDRNGIPLIYDAAHTMGAKYKNIHLANYGLASVLSFHATKILSSVEGGAVVTNCKELIVELKNFRNFGRDNSGRIIRNEATNSKLSELHAAMGLLQLQKFNEVLERRQRLYEYYVSSLSVNTSYRSLKPRLECEVNGSYMPIVTDLGRERRNTLVSMLKLKGIISRPYFDTVLTEMCSGSRYHKTELPNAQYLCDNVLCLPIHSSMTESDVDYIVKCLSDIEVE